jgi:transcriptional regulator
MRRKEPEWWEVARTLRQEGWTQERIAKRFGKTRGAVVRALRPAYYTYMNTRLKMRKAGRPL